MLFMVVERFEHNDMIPVYRRFRESGRQLPEGLKYVSSWIEVGFARCFQLMETNDLRTLGNERSENTSGVGARLARNGGNL
jgi:hypothetical protein